MPAGFQLVKTVMSGDVSRDDMMDMMEDPADAAVANKYPTLLQPFGPAFAMWGLVFLSSLLLEIARAGLDLRPHSFAFLARRIKNRNPAVPLAIAMSVAGQYFWRTVFRAGDEDSVRNAAGPMTLIWAPMLAIQLLPVRTVSVFEKGWLGIYYAWTTAAAGLQFLTTLNIAGKNWDLLYENIGPPLEDTTSTTPGAPAEAGASPDRTAASESVVRVQRGVVPAVATTILSAFCLGAGWFNGFWPHAFVLVWYLAFQRIQLERVWKFYVDTDSSAQSKRPAWFRGTGKVVDAEGWKQELLRKQLEEETEGEDGEDKKKKHPSTQEKEVLLRSGLSLAGAQFVRQTNAWMLVISAVAVAVRVLPFSLSSSL